MLAAHAASQRRTSHLADRHGLLRGKRASVEATTVKRYLRRRYGMIQGVVDFVSTTGSNRKNRRMSLGNCFLQAVERMVGVHQLVATVQLDLEEIGKGCLRWVSTAADQVGGAAAAAQDGVRSRWVCDDRKIEMFQILFLRCEWLCQSKAFCFRDRRRKGREEEMA